MQKGNAKVVSTTSREEYRVDFSLRVQSRKKKALAGVTGYGKSDGLSVTSADGRVIPDGDYNLHPDGTNDVIAVHNSGGLWALR
jgi:hypothetical protein